MKLLKQKSTLLPDMQFKKIIGFEESQKTARLYFKPKIKFLKERNINNIFLKMEKNEIFNKGFVSEKNKRSWSNKIINKEINNKKSYNINDLKEEIKLLKNQLNDEKIKSEVLKQIAEEEQKKHILYKKKFRTIFSSKGALMDEVISQNNNSKITLSYVEEKDKYKNNNIYSFKNKNNYKSVKNLTNKINNSGFNSFILSPRKEHASPSQTIPVNNKIDIIKKVILNKKIKFTKDKKNEEIIELKEKNSKKDKLIEELNKKIKEIKIHNIQLLNDKKIIEEDNIKLKDEIDFKNKEIETLKAKLNEELTTNQAYVKKFKEIKDINQKFLNKLEFEKEQNKKLRKLLSINFINKKKEEINILKNENENNNCLNKSNNLENSLDKNTKRSLEINGMKDISNISCIERKQQIGQYELEDISLKEIFQNKLLDFIEIKYDTDSINK